MTGTPWGRHGHVVLVPEHPSLRDCYEVLRAADGHHLGWVRLLDVGSWAAEAHYAWPSGVHGTKRRLRLPNLHAAVMHVLRWSDAKAWAVERPVVWSVRWRAHLVPADLVRGPRPGGGRWVCFDHNARTRFTVSRQSHAFAVESATKQAALSRLQSIARVRAVAASAAVDAAQVCSDCTPPCRVCGDGAW